MGKDVLKNSLQTVVPQEHWYVPCVKKSPIADLMESLDWTFIKNFERDKTVLEKLIDNRPFLMTQYRVQAAQLIHLIESKPKNDPQLIAEIEKALKMTVLLKKIYQHIDEPDDVLRAEIDEAILKTVLYKIEYPNDPVPIKIPASEASFSQQLRGLVLQTNLSRLTGIRLRRLILAYLAFSITSLYRNTVSTIELFTNPFFLYLGWMFFLPRLLLNLFFSLKHIIPNPWMPDKTRQLHWFSRMSAYFRLHRRGFELWTDAVWFSGGILLCFTLTGALFPLRPFIVVAMQVSDVILVTVRSIIELRRRYILKQDYLNGVKNKLIAPNPTYLKALNERIDYEKKANSLAITNNLLMVMALSTLIPAIGVLHPLLPFLGAALGVFTTFRFYVLNSHIEASPPRTNLNQLLKHYDIKAPTPPPLPPLAQLAIPAVVTLAPLFFLCVTFASPLGIMASVTLLSLFIIKLLAPAKENPVYKPYHQLAHFNFFKPEIESTADVKKLNPQPLREYTPSRNPS